MVRKLETGEKAGIWIGGIIIVGLLVIFLWPSTAAPFGFACKDSRTGGSTIPNDHVTARLYGLDADGDPTDWSDFVELDTVTDLDEITAADIAAYQADGYVHFYLNASATNEDREWTDFHAKWFELSTTTQNVLEFEATPTTAGAVCFSPSFTTATANITETQSDAGANWDWANNVGNFSVSVGINNTDIDYCAYESYYDYQAQEYTYVKLVFNFNSTSIDNNDLAIVNQIGDTWVRSASLYNTTAIAFECAAFTQISTLDFVWDDDVAATGICISEFLVVWEPANTSGATTVLFRSS